MFSSKMINSDTKGCKIIIASFAIFTYMILIPNQIIHTARKEQLLLYVPTPHKISKK
jgi:hypothetical protein